MKPKRHSQYLSSHLLRMTEKKGISSIITTIIITGVLLVILVVASFVSANILNLQVANTEFEQAKSSMLLLDDIIQDVSLRPGSGGYAQFNERTGGIGISQQTNNVILQIYAGQTSTTLNPNAAGSYSEWFASNTMVNRWNLTNDNDDDTWLMTGTQGARELQKFDQATQFNDVDNSINNITFSIRASSPDTSQNQIKIILRSNNVPYTDPTPHTVNKNNFRLIQVTFINNPVTSHKWTWGDINSLEIGSVASYISTGTVQVSKWYITVDFGPPTAKPTKNILNGQYLFTHLVYSGGNLASAAETDLRGTDSTKVDTAEGLGFLRVEQDNGPKIRLDYDRLRIDDETLVDATHGMIQITMLNLTMGNMGGSGTVNARVQNIQTTSTPYIVGTSSVTVKLVWSTPSGTISRSFAFTKYSAQASAIVVMFTTISIQVSTA